MNVHGGGTLNLLSWNVRGLNSPVKRGKVYAHLKKLGAEIVFLQETHIKTTTKFSIKAPWMSQVYQSNSSTKAREVLLKSMSPLYISKLLRM